MTPAKPQSFYMIEMESRITPGEKFYIHANSIGDGMKFVESWAARSRFVGIWLMKPTLVPESEWKNGSGNS